MSEPQSHLTTSGFVKTFVVPSLLIFVIPIIGLAFFYHAQSTFDANARTEILQQIQNDKQLDPVTRQRNLEFFQRIPLSQLMVNDEFAKVFDANVRFEFATFRWMIRLSLLLIVAGISVYVVAGVCIALSTRSRHSQYLCLSLGWQILRIYSALQTVITGAIIVGLSYWVTALWFKVYVVKLIFLIGLIVVCGVLQVIASIFKRVTNDFRVEGVILDRDKSVELWAELKSICERVGTTAPDHVIAGIDDNFFVTETPVLIGNVAAKGKSLYVSLPLLKQLNSTEADSILAHEMAHFSGQDTVFSKSISPLLIKYTIYLNALHQGAFTLPVYYFMNCFRALFELSLGATSREREFRADRIAAETTSSKDGAAALLRTMAYSKFRASVEQDLYLNERKLDVADVSRRIDQGFKEFAIKFGANPEIGRMEAPHPFDSHPPLSQRLSAIGFELNPGVATRILSAPVDGGWYLKIPEAEAVEHQLWVEYEDRFRKNHEESLPYRFLPSTDEERAIVEAAFPTQEILGKKNSIILDCDGVQMSDWPSPVFFRDITKCQYDQDAARLLIHYQEHGIQHRSVRFSEFKKDVLKVILQDFERYYGRYLAAVAFRNQVEALKIAEKASPTEAGGVATEQIADPNPT